MFCVFEQLLAQSAGKIRLAQVGQIPVVKGLADVAYKLCLKQ